MSRPQAFVVCDEREIATGEARAFSLLRAESGGARPFAILVARTHAGVFGYANQCPHEGAWLNIGDGALLTPDRRRLRCGRHGATFEIESGLCVSGPCQGESLHPLAFVVIDGDVCLLGETIVEEMDEEDETLEILIHPD